jgi:hypothetical protein
MFSIQFPQITQIFADHILRISAQFAGTFFWFNYESNKSIETHPANEGEDQL